MNPKIEISLPILYRKKLFTIEDELNCSHEEALLFLIDLYFLEHYTSVQLFRRILSKRIRKGINYSFLVQLRILYTFIGHFLKKVKQL